VKGEGRNCELAECAMRRGVSVRAYAGAEAETANGRSGKEHAPFPLKMGRKKRKEGEFRKKVHKFSFGLSMSSKNKTFFSRKIRLFEIKILVLRLIKHNFPFIPPHCGVHIAQSRETFPNPPAQTLFDLLNPSRLRLIPSYRNRPQRRCSSQSGDICTTATRPLGFVGIWVCRERRRSKGLFFFHKKGALAFFGQRALGKSIRLLSCPHAANPTIII